MKIFVMGLTACGKSRQAKNIGIYFGLTYISGSQLLLNALEFEDNSIDHFWIEETGRQLDKKREQISCDQEVDTRLLFQAKNEDNVVFDSWTLPWLYKGQDAIRIYLNPTVEARAKMAHRSKENKKYNLAQLTDLLKQKDETSRNRFMNLYGFDICDTAPFDFVFDNSTLERDETTDCLINYIRKRYKINSLGEWEKARHS